MLIIKSPLIKSIHSKKISFNANSKAPKLMLYRECGIMRADKLLTVKQRELLTNQLFEGSTKILHHGVRLCFALLSKVGLANAHVNSGHHLTIIIKFINTIIIASLHLDILMRSSKAKCIDSLCSAGHPSVEEKSDNGLVLVGVVGGDVYRFVWCGGGCPKGSED